MTHEGYSDLSTVRGGADVQSKIRFPLSVITEQRAHDFLYQDIES